MIAQIKINERRGKMGQGGVYEIAELRRESIKHAHSVEDAIDWVKRQPGYSGAHFTEYPLMDGSVHWMVETDWQKDGEDDWKLLFGDLGDDTDYHSTQIYITRTETIK